MYNKLVIIDVSELGTNGFYIAQIKQVDFAQ